MSGVAGADRVQSRKDFLHFVDSYKKNVISTFPGVESVNYSGSFKSNKSKTTFGDIDLIVTITSDKTKKEVKKELIDYLLKLSSNVIVPFTSEKYKGRRVYNSGEIVTVNYFDNKLGYSVQIDNIIALDKKEGKFKEQFLDWTAAKQGLILGLVKTAAIETAPEILFKKLNIEPTSTVEENQEYEFNLSGKELQLRIVSYVPGTFKEQSRNIIWSSTNTNDIKKVLYQYNLDVSFEDLVAQVKQKIKNKRSKPRIRGIFTSMVTVKSGERGTEKEKEKQDAINTIINLTSEQMTFKKYWRDNNGKF